ncbi:hypothetical protein D3C86_1604000 [compost metagenome]
MVRTVEEDFCVADVGVARLVLVVDPQTSELRIVVRHDRGQAGTVFSTECAEGETRQELSFVSEVHAEEVWTGSSTSSHYCWFHAKESALT